MLSIISAHGYLRYEDSIDTELETEQTRSDVRVIKSSTTTIPILVYHKISDNFLPLPEGRQPLRRFSVEKDVFEAQMQYIKKEGYTPLTVRDLIKDEQRGILPNKPIAITFDDGWRSQYKNALPILTQEKIPGTFYIYTGVIGSPAYMTWEDLHYLISLNMEIGDHTRSHPRLTKIAPSKLDEELLQSKAVLERNLHVPVTDFAYPYGAYNDSIIEALKKDGYSSGRTSNKSIYNDFKDPYRLNVLYAPSDLKTLENLLN